MARVSSFGGEGQSLVGQLRWGRSCCGHIFPRLWLEFLLTADAFIWSKDGEDCHGFSDSLFSKMADVEVDTFLGAKRKDPFSLFVPRSPAAGGGPTPGRRNGGL